MVGVLPPDSVIPLLAIEDDAYKIPNGYVQRHTMQPILPYETPVVLDHLGTGQWVEVIAPSSVIREACLADSKVLDRVGNGAVMYACDRMVDAHGAVWYGIAAAPDTAFLGWLPALQCRAWALTPSAAGDLLTGCVLNLDTLVLTCLAGDQTLAEIPFYITGSLPTDESLLDDLTLRLLQPGGRLIRSDEAYLGAAWQFALQAEGTTVGQVLGAYWHNQFGLGAAPSNAEACIQLPILAARWLYHAVASFSATGRELAVIIE
jgi:hypothetical protein